MKKNTINFFDFTDKSVIVSGGGTGIGYEITKSFIKSGALVTIVGRRLSKLEDALISINKEFPGSNKKISIFECDMSNEDSVIDLFKNVMSKFNKIDMLINNCGDWSINKISNIKDNEINDHFNNILKTTILGTKLSSKYMKRQGVIINLGSFSGILPMKNASIYSLLKSSINTFTKSSASELSSKNIRVNCVLPGVIRTPMTSNYIDENYDRIIKPIAMGRVGKPTEIANAILFLCSDLASYITGATLEVSGGKYLTQL